MGTETEALARHAPKPGTDIASLAALRVLFGGALFVATIRFFASGSVASYWGEPTRFFTYWGLRFVHPWSVTGMYVHYALIATAALAITLGVFYRPACLALAVLFGYAHFADKTNYLNHYWFVTSLALVLAFVPADRAFSLRTWWRPADKRTHIPWEMLAFVRLQIGVVYVFGGLAKLNSDWLLDAQPLTIWLGANTDFPIFGRFFGMKAVCYAFSWCGALYDLFIVPALLTRRTRPFAYAAVLFFHIVTAKLFQIGIFPWVMIAMSPIFFDADWPIYAAKRMRALLTREETKAIDPAESDLATHKMADPWPTYVVALVVAWSLFQTLLPLRQLLYPGSHYWTEEGFRFSWNVMIVEKNASIEMWTVNRATGVKKLVDSHRWVTPVQWKQMSTQPDMLLEYAHWVRDDAAAAGQDVAVYMDVRVAWNGRTSAPLIDSSIDLAREQDTLAPKRWILPAPNTKPEW